MNRKDKIEQFESFLNGLRLVRVNRVGEIVKGWSEINPHQVIGVVINKDNYCDMVMPYKGEIVTNSLYEFTGLKGIKSKLSEETQKAVEDLEKGNLINMPFEVGTEIELSNEFAKKNYCLGMRFVIDCVKSQLKPIDGKEENGYAMNSLVEVKSPAKRFRFKLSEYGELFELVSWRRTKETRHLDLIQMTDNGIIRPVEIHKSGHVLLIDNKGIYLKKEDEKEFTFVTEWEDWVKNKVLNSLLRERGFGSIGLGIGLLSRCRRYIAPYWLMEHHVMK